MSDGKATGAVQIYTGTVGLTPPERPSTTPIPAAWLLVGNMDTEIDEAGLDVMADHTLERVYKHNSTLVQRFLRTQEMAGFSCVLEDVTHEVLAHLLNDNTVQDAAYDAGPPIVFGRQRVGFHRGTEVHELATLVIISASPYEDAPGGKGMVYYPAGAITSNLNSTVQKGEVMMVPFAYEAREYIYSAAEITAIFGAGAPAARRAAEAAVGFWDWEDDTG